MKRRRCLQIIAAVALAPRSAMASRSWHEWRGVALGSDAFIRLPDDGAQSRQALAAALDTIRRMESLFSLHDPQSALMQLNRTGHLQMPPAFEALMDRVNAVHHLTQGLFDPTIQPLWCAHAYGGDVDAARRLVGWSKVVRRGHSVHFTEPGMAMTLNGIAQGFATDRVAATLQAYGYTDQIVNVGEYRAGDASLNLGIIQQNQRLPVDLAVTGQAVATSETMATNFGDGASHILHPAAKGLKPSVRSATVVAATATMADGLSTALCLDQRDMLVERLLRSDHVSRIVLGDEREGRDYSEKGMTAFSIPG